MWAEHSLLGCILSGPISPRLAGPQRVGSVISKSSSAGAVPGREKDLGGHWWFVSDPDSAADPRVTPRECAPCLTFTCSVPTSLWVELGVMVTVVP